MKSVRVPYTRYLVSRPNERKAAHVYRPVVPVRLTAGTQAVTFDALVDSGADECIFPGWVISEFGRDLYAGKEKIFSGIGGSVLAYMHRTRMELNGIRFTTDVYYSHEWDDLPFGLVGQAGFFSRFNVTFNYAAKWVSFRSR